MVLSTLSHMRPKAWLGASTPSVGASSPARWLLTLGLALSAIGCGESEETRTLPPLQVGMTQDVAPLFESDDLTLYEVKLPVQFPIKTPTPEQQNALNDSPIAPFPAAPWVTSDEVQVQVSWTLTNLDAEDHNVALIVDPWNEFGRYVPGITVEDDEAIPNLSGIEVLFELPGTSSARSSRRQGTLTVQDMGELAIDFATAMNILANAPPPDPNSEATPVTTLVNHAFAVENRSYKDPLVAGYIPGTIPALTGMDIGLRTDAPANLALEFVIEMVDKGADKVIPRDSDDQPLPEPSQVITAAAAP